MAPIIPSPPSLPIELGTGLEVRTLRQDVHNANAGSDAALDEGAAPCRSLVACCPVTAVEHLVVLMHRARRQPAPLETPRPDLLPQRQSGTI